MYDDRIEGLIDAALADGVLTEKEKQILFKRAEASGINLDEFEMVLEARLVELRKKEIQMSTQQEIELAKAKATTSAASAAPRSNKYGDIRKCPSCGAILKSFDAVCPECGYERTDVDGNSSTQRLSEILNRIEREDAGIASASGDISKSTARKITAIQSFPIPNTKEDLVEFIAMSAANASVADDGRQDTKKLREAWSSKIEQAVMKARIFFKGDSVIESICNEQAKRFHLLEYHRWYHDVKIRKRAIIRIPIVALIIIFLFWFCSHLH